MTATYGIDQLAFYTPGFCLDLKTLAEHRGVDPDKYTQGLGQFKMGVPSPDEDIVTMAAEAASKILQTLSPQEIESIDWLIFATESAFDHSKAAGIYLQHLLNLPSHLRVIEFKQACYSATAGLELGLSYIKANPSKRVLLIASDIARYGLHTSGESSQGGGAMALLLSQNPRALHIEDGSGVYTEDVMDFWRPSYRSEALVEGKYSCDMYLKSLEMSFSRYKEITGRSFKDHQHFLYHIPLPRLAEKAHQKLCRLNGTSFNPEILSPALAYSRLVGNCYTAALYLGLASLLENTPHSLSGERIGLYSYGSGCVSQFFSGRVDARYQTVLSQKTHQEMLVHRQDLSIEKYEDFYRFQLPIDGSECLIPHYKKSGFRLTKMQDHKRFYEKVPATFEHCQETLLSCSIERETT